MTAITITIVVERPIEEVFAFVTDTRNDPLWQSAAGLQESRHLPEGPVGVGTQITEIRHFMGVRAQSTSEVTTYEPAKQYARHLLSGSSPIMQGAYVFEPATTGTLWTCSALIQASGDFAIAETALAVHLRTAMETSMARAKAMLERRITDILQ